jgi:hypothetical protein
MSPIVQRVIQNPPSAFRFPLPFSAIRYQSSAAGHSYLLPQRANPPLRNADVPIGTRNPNFE